MATLIHLIIPDDNPLGIRTAEIPSKSLRAFVVPRALWKVAANSMNELQHSGVYFLIGEQNEEGLFNVYIGEAQNVLDRVSRHVSDAEKDFWNYAVCFVTSDGSLHKSHAKLLESCLCRLAKTSGRTHLHNGNAPQTQKLPTSDNITCMQFLSDIQILLPSLGFPILTLLSKNKKQKKYFCKGPFAAAKGIYTEEGFVVLKGSLTRKEWTPSVDREKPIREKMIADGVLEEANANSYRFTRDYKFPMPSPAAVMVLARAANGWHEWKDEQGKTLHENERFDAST
ncbi:hypothetical protein A3A67_05280 [Candidatus Peribacteria bacterium RIFCSPLOWO2_01_FULL_51_18]|nr:MAG: hypothetical protein A3C52_02920 [Candidatus Peribacteria bacterium RIFCSPHIGHO2_02_FULL_51_15]OGJ66745.1 MAG: hypothetical protein A3A67_05280 [Candidatus Peribacteria bacterium RIFCSPLOWO2_01_FULL_51_18]OGJ69576.1 MAG: hypothetical protein A3J34_00005 [Candidatus Peribacteria bacterium RIFCSPLOWO2_02_FULL_51_10]